jgi:hypothetical protein
MDSWSLGKFVTIFLYDSSFAVDKLLVAITGLVSIEGEAFCFPFDEKLGRDVLSSVLRLFAL